MYTFYLEDQIVSNSLVWQNYTKHLLYASIMLHINTIKSRGLREEAGNPDKSLQPTESVLCTNEGSSKMKEIYHPERSGRVHRKDLRSEKEVRQTRWIIFYLLRWYLVKPNLFRQCQVALSDGSGAGFKEENHWEENNKCSSYILVLVKKFPRRETC